MFKSENFKSKAKNAIKENKITESDNIDDRKQKKALKFRGKLPEDPTFYVTCHPEELEQIEIMWKVALLVEEKEVKRTAAAFLVNLYLNVFTKPIKDKKQNPNEQELKEMTNDAKKKHTEMTRDRKENAKAFIQKVFNKMEEYKEEPKKVQRLIYILKSMIKVTELTGLNVQPHYALDQGEMIRAITVKL